MDVAQIYNLFSPNSLYFTETSDDLQILVNGTAYNYQSNEESPAIFQIYDDTADGAGGTIIPLVAAESLNDDNDRIVVFGDTSFSDFSFAPHFLHDNEHIIPTIIEWVLFDNVAGGYSYLPGIVIGKLTEVVPEPVAGFVPWITLPVSQDPVKLSTPPPFRITGGPAVPGILCL